MRTPSCLLESEDYSYSDPCFINLQSQVNTVINDTFRLRLHRRVGLQQLNCCQDKDEGSLPIGMVTGQPIRRNPDEIH